MRTIGNLGEEIKQHSNPFSNLSQHRIRRTRANALMAMIPDLDVERTTNALPRGSRDVGGGFVLLRPCEAVPHALRDCEAVALRESFPNTQMGVQVCVRRWAKLRIPTRQNCYSMWKELEKPLERRRTACNIKACHPFLCVCTRP